MGYPFGRFLFKAIITIIGGGLFFFGFAIFLSVSSPKSSSSEPSAVVTNTAVATTGKPTALTPTATEPPTPAIITTLTPKVTQPVTEPGLNVISPTVAIGAKIPLPLSGQVDISVFRTADPPLISLQQARMVIYKHGLEWASGGTHEGKQVTLTAVYGLVTLGGPNTGGNKQGWLGPQNIDLPVCASLGECVPSGVILNHIEKRPMWVLDYGNTDFPAAGVACMTTPCPTPQIFNHSVYTVDGQTGAAFTGDFYTVP